MSKTSSLSELDNSEQHFIENIRRASGIEQFDLAVVLGSGWQSAADIGRFNTDFNYPDWPCFPAGQIKGHDGRLVVTRYSGWNILLFCGRFHCYQGLTAYQSAFTVRLADALGCPRILLTCAAGGINASFRPGDFMLVEDHINLLGDNPLRGLSGDFFVDMSNVYESGLYDLVSAASGDRMPFHRGVLAAVHGPSYETPAEIRFLANAGADVVSMSIVAEATMARYFDMQTAAVAFVSNFAAGVNPTPLTHEDVLECSRANSDVFPRVLKNVVDCWTEVEL